MTISSVKQSETIDNSNRFRVIQGSFSFHRQYAKIYAARLADAKQILLRRISCTWKNQMPTVPVCSLADLLVDEKSIVVGTIYKEMKLKPSILRDIASAETANAHSNVTLIPQSGGSYINLSSEDDSIFLEDEVQRISLIFSDECIQKGCSLTNLVTGIVVAILGYEPKSNLGSFYVEKILFLEPQPEKPFTIKCIDQKQNKFDPTYFRNSGPWLGLVSGLGFTGTGEINKGHAMALHLLGDWLRCAGDFENSSQTQSGFGIVRLMILGDSIRISGLNCDDVNDHNKPASRLSQRARYLTRYTDADSVTAMSRLDQWLASLPIGNGYSEQNKPINGMSIDLLPGLSDPTSLLMPQQPIHSSALPLAVSRSGGVGHNGICGRTNPYQCNIFGRHILATSGQGVNELIRYTGLKSSCDRMEATLLWGHLAPTCPDTLPGYPLIDKDTLLMQFSKNNDISSDYPDIYIAGCQPEQLPNWRRARLKWDETVDENHHNNGALLISVPRFDLSHSIVLVNLKTFDCHTVLFDTALLDQNEI